jgi:hypothetical protein
MPTESGIDIGERHYLGFKDQPRCVDTLPNYSIAHILTDIKHPQMIYTLGGGSSGSLPIVNTLGIASPGIQ